MGAGLYGASQDLHVLQSTPSKKGCFWTSRAPAEPNLAYTETCNAVSWGLRWFTNAVSWELLRHTLVGFPREKHEEQGGRGTWPAEG